jgi:hypothetical protein
MRIRMNWSLKTMMATVVVMALVSMLVVRYTRHWGERRLAIAIHLGQAMGFAKSVKVPATPEVLGRELERMSVWHTRRASELRWVFDFDPCWVHEMEAAQNRFDHETMGRVIEARRLAGIAARSGAR